MSASDRIKQAKAAIQAADSPRAGLRAAERHGVRAEREYGTWGDWVARGHGLSTIWAHRTKAEAVVAWANGQTSGAEALEVRIRIYNASWR